MKKTALSFTASLAWLVITSLLLLLPDKAVDQEGWLHLLLQTIGIEQLPEWLHPDKIVHVFLFGVLVLLWYWSLLLSGQTHRQTKLLPLVVLVALSYGIAIEYIQEWMQNGRHFDTLDMVADGIGCLLGAGLGRWYEYRQAKKKRPL